MEMPIKLCKCQCHREGELIFHTFPCCPLCDIKYLDKDGNLKKNYKEIIKNHENIIPGRRSKQNKDI